MLTSSFTLIHLPSDHCIPTSSPSLSIGHRLVGKAYVLAMNRSRLELLLQAIASRFLLLTAQDATRHTASIT